MSELALAYSHAKKPTKKADIMIELPASWESLLETFRKVRTTLADDAARKITWHNRPYLSAHLGSDSDLIELNILARLLSELDVFESVYLYGLVRIVEKECNGEPMSLPLLINLAYSIDSSYIAPGVRNDEALGRFLYKHDMLSDGRHEAARFKEVFSAYSDQYFAKIGREHREAERGVFMQAGYIELGNVYEVYRRPGQVNGEIDASIPAELKQLCGWSHPNSPSESGDSECFMQL